MFFSFSIGETTHLRFVVANLRSQLQSRSAGLNGPLTRF